MSHAEWQKSELQCMSQCCNAYVACRLTNVAQHLFAFQVSVYANVSLIACAGDDHGGVGGAPSLTVPGQDQEGEG